MGLRWGRVILARIGTLCNRMARPRIWGFVARHDLGCSNLGTMNVLLASSRWGLVVVGTVVIIAVALQS
jgi:hypothetical protein